MSMWNPQNPPQHGPQGPMPFGTPAAAPPGPAVQSPPERDPKRAPDSRLVVRLIGSALLALAALGVYFGMALAHPSSAADRVSQALSNDKLNQDQTTGAPQQAVANGWVARDLLAIIATDSDNDDRPAALLTLGVIGLAFFAATSPANAHSYRRAAPPEARS